MCVNGQNRRCSSLSGNANFLSSTVFVDQRRADSIMARSLSPQTGRIHLRRPNHPRQRCCLQSGGGPYNFHGLLFARQMLDKPICRIPVQCAHSLRDAHRYSSLVDECIWRFITRREGASVRRSRSHARWIVRDIAMNLMDSLLEPANPHRWGY